ncbi:MAG: hypothetical protein Q9197_004745 [Variospora fuerteventurae]
MTLRYSLPLAALAVSGLAANVPAFNDANRGWCYFCSDDGAPPLCNNHCETAIEKLCSEDLKLPWTDAEQNCQVQFFPPVTSSNALDTAAVTKETCLSQFRGILNMCGKDAGDDRLTHDPAYCTTSGGGGTYGWNDDGSVMVGSARYRIIAKDTNQCGQHEASWMQATSIIQWNDSWVGPDDQVVLDTNPPAAAITDFPEPPAPNPECQKEVCNIYDEPYYARPGTDKQNWIEQPGVMRHRVEFDGFAKDDGATALHQALIKRCHAHPDNFQSYKAGETRIVDFGLRSTAKSDLCFCIPDAIFDASAGITIDRMTWCKDSKPRASPRIFNFVDKTELKKSKRSIGLFNQVPYVLHRDSSLPLKGCANTDDTCRKKPAMKRRMLRWLGMES